MTKTLAEVLLLLSVSSNAVLLIFIAGVLRKVMNDMDPAAFRSFLGSLVAHSKKSPFMLIALNLPLVVAIPYFYVYGFGNRWIIAGLSLWLLGGSIGKIMKIPLYKEIGALDPGDIVQLIEARRKLNAGNLLQTAFYLVAVALMTIPLINR